MPPYLQDIEFYYTGTQIADDLSSIAKCIGENGGEADVEGFNADVDEVNPDGDVDFETDFDDYGSESEEELCPEVDLSSPTTKKTDSKIVRFGDADTKQYP